MIHPVILCGGSGTRLWPLSRKSYPKQFVKLTGEKSLFQETLLRLSGEDFADPLILTGDPFRFIVSEQMATVGVQSIATMIEPEGRNTAPAVLAAALWYAKRDPTALLLVAPSDHVIPDTEAFRNAVNAAAPSALAGDMVTFGIQPTRAETAYGYLQLADGGNANANKPQKLIRFVEKPDSVKACEMYESGKYLWNAGIFLFTAETLISSYKKHAAGIFAGVRVAVEKARLDLGFTRLAEESWSALEDISIDCAVMERADNLSVMPYSRHWSDLGGWDAVWIEGNPDQDGNVCTEKATAIDCRGSLLRSDSDEVELVGIGLDGMMAVAMADAVLVAPRSESQRVKEAVATLQKRGATQATENLREHRPWGWYERLAVGSRFQVKQIVVNPGAALSLQSHNHRAEHWVVVRGTAKVTIDDKVSLVTENESVYVPLGAVHRMENPGKIPMVLIEVQTGSYLKEDDIHRFEDIYARGSTHSQKLIVSEEITCR